MLPQALLLLLATASQSLAAPTQTNILKRDVQTSTLYVPSSELQQPSSMSPAVAVKQVVLGLGHQNYSCDASGALTAIGATAALYDIKPTLSTISWLTNTIPGLALSFSGMHTDTQPNSLDKSLDNLDYTRSLALGALVGIKQLGTHFFAADKSPTFDMPAASPPSRLVAKKLGAVTAPAGSCPGPDGAGAVDWLLLTDNGTNRTFGGLSHVYRVVTAGGKPPANCAGSPSGSIVRVPYAAEYWFYGPTTS